MEWTHSQESRSVLIMHINLRCPRTGTAAIAVSASLRLRAHKSSSPGNHIATPTISAATAARRSHTTCLRLRTRSAGAEFAEAAPEVPGDPEGEPGALNGEPGVLLEGESRMVRVSGVGETPTPSTGSFEGELSTSTLAAMADGVGCSASMLVVTLCPVRSRSCRASSERAKLSLPAHGINSSMRPRADCAPGLGRPPNLPGQAENLASTSCEARSISAQLA